MENKILVAYASRNGSTEGVAAAIAGELRARGEKVEVRKVTEIGSLEGYASVIAGSAIQDNKWLPEALEFVANFSEDLRKRKFAAFQVCMTLAMKKADRYLPFVMTWMDPVRKIVTPVKEGFFPGVLNVKNVQGFGNRLKFRVSIWFGVWKEGDHRNWQEIRDWAGEYQKMV